jgi:hypothetical protein
VDNRPRTDGVDLAHDDGSSAYNYLRFYADGRVVEVTSTGTPTDVAAWLAYEHPPLSRGYYHLVGQRLRFTTTSDAGMVDFSGAIQPGGDTIEMALRSRINRYKGRRRYTFVPVAFGK